MRSKWRVWGPRTGTRCEYIPAVDGPCSRAPHPPPALDVAPDPDCKTVCRREKVRPGTGREAGLGHAAVEPTGRYLRRVLQPGSGCRVSPSWLSFSDNQVVECHIAEMIAEFIFGVMQVDKLVNITPTREGVLRVRFCKTLIIWWVNNLKSWS